MHATARAVYTTTALLINGNLMSLSHDWFLFWRRSLVSSSGTDLRTTGQGKNHLIGKSCNKCCRFYC